MNLGVAAMLGAGSFWTGSGALFANQMRQGRFHMAKKVHQDMDPAASNRRWWIKIGAVTAVGVLWLAGGIGYLATRTPARAGEGKSGGVRRRAAPHASARPEALEGLYGRGAGRGAAPGDLGALLAGRTAMARNLLQVVLVAHLCGGALCRRPPLRERGRAADVQQVEPRTYVAMARPLLRRGGACPAASAAAGDGHLRAPVGRGWGPGPHGLSAPPPSCSIWASSPTTLALNVPINVELLSHADLPLERLAALRTRWALAHGLAAWACPASPGDWDRAATTR